MEKRIRKHFSRELENIKKLILSLGASVEERVRMATKAIEDNDAELAQRIIKSDYEIDEMEVEIEEEVVHPDRHAIGKSGGWIDSEIDRLAVFRNGPLLGNCRKVAARIRMFLDQRHVVVVVDPAAKRGR